MNIIITSSMLSIWGNGKLAHVYDQLKHLASYYNVTTDFLLGFKKYDNLAVVDSNNNLDTNKKYL
jgi:hypothetical protein